MNNESYDGAHSERARHLTHHFNGIQGYKWLPWVLPLLLWWGSEASVLRGDWWPWAFAGALVLAGAATWLAGRWYARAYGRVYTKRDTAGPRIAVWLAIGAAALMLLFLGALPGGLAPFDLHSVPVAWSAAVLGLVLAAWGWRLRPVSAHVWWLGVVLTVGSLAPLGWLPVFGGGHPFNAEGAIFGVMAVIVLAVGIGSHRALKRTFAVAEGDEE